LLIFSNEFAICEKESREGITKFDDTDELLLGAIARQVQAAIENMLSEKQTYIIKDKGRTIDEDAVVIVQEAVYTGYGFVPKSVSINAMEDIMAFLIPQKDNLETTRLIQTYRIKNPNSILDFSSGILKSVQKV